MGVFLGQTKNTDAVKAALQLNWVVKNLINRRIKSQYPNANYEVRHTVGIDTSELIAIRAGVRDSNDIAWIGGAANHAAKLNGLSSNWSTRITGTVYDRMLDQAKFGGDPRRNMWEKRVWTPMENMTIYRSSGTWSIN
jgi:class 3 adenylate cyclase